MDAAETSARARAVVAVLTRAPSDRGKSRLCAELGIPPDPALSTALLLDTIDAVSSTDWTRVVFVHPPGSCDEVRAIVPADVRVMPQRGGDLGERMHGALEDLFAEGAMAVALVGSDLPEIDLDALAAAFDALALDPDVVVLGPARDGGYYLIAATTTPDLFEGITWGSADVLNQTIDLAARRGKRIRLVQACDDVDSLADLRRATAQHPDGKRRAIRTRSWAETALIRSRPDV